MNNNITISSTESIRVALQKIGESGSKCITVVDKSKKLIGTLSDGDLRRAILKKKKLTDSILSIFNKNPFFLIDKKYSKNEIRNFFLKNKLDIVPIVNEKKILIKTLSLSETFKDTNIFKKINNVTTVIMAGGKGTRLRPFTNVLPKPLIPIQGKTAIEKIIEHFRLYGLNSFTISIHEKSEIIKAFFHELKPSYKIKFIEEDKPLGTIGSLNLIKKKELKKDLLVTNCDILSNFDLYDFYNFHKEKGFDITIVASDKKYIIPYGVCNISKNGRLIKVQEKPSLDFLVNIGIYLLNKKVLKLISKNKACDTNQLINLARKKGFKVGVFHVSDTNWSDIGQWSEFSKLENNI